MSSNGSYEESSNGSSKVSEGQWMSLSLKDNEGQSVRPIPPTFLCALYEATTVSPLEKNG